jgi:hypothetical protein
MRRAVATAVCGAAAGSLVLSPPSVAIASASPSAPVATGGPGDAEKSIVYVGIGWTGYVQFPTEDGGLAWSDPVEVAMNCTGWFASDEGHIVTAGHCLDPDTVEIHILRRFLAENDASHLEQDALDWQVSGWETGSPDRGDVWVVQPSAVEGAVIDEPLTVQVLDYRPMADGDLALLKANGLAEATPPLSIAPESPTVGDSVTAIGYPASVAGHSDAARLRASFKSGTVSSTQVTEHGVAGTEINADLSGGMSGGPTVDATGQVLGVNSFGVGDGQSFNFITDGSALRDYLEQQGLDLAVAPVDVGSEPAGDTASAPRETVTTAADDALPSWALLAAGGALVVILAAGGAYMVARRRPMAAAAPVAYAGSMGVVPGAGTPTGGVPDGASTAGCGHPHSAPGARFCLDCGSRLIA